MIISWRVLGIWSAQFFFILGRLWEIIYEPGSCHSCTRHSYPKPATTWQSFLKIAQRVKELWAAQGFSYRRTDRWTDRWTERQTDANVITISPEPICWGIKNIRWQMSKKNLKTPFSPYKVYRNAQRQLTLAWKSKKENPQKLTQLNSRSHPRHLVGKRTAQKDTIIDITSDSQANSNFSYRWSPASFTTILTYFYIYI